MDFESNYVEMMALGRHFKIGTLYNYVEDVIISDVQLWIPSSVTSRLDFKSKKEKTVQTLSVSGSDEDESTLLSDLEFDDHSAMSLTAGLIHQVGGAWQYVADLASIGKLKSFNTGYHVVVHCRRSSKKISVNPFSIKTCCVQRDELINSKATHVVVAITYGLEAFCIFSPQHSMNNSDDDEDKSNNDVLKHAQCFAHSLLQNSIQLEPFRNQTNGYHQVPMDISCVLYSDLLTDNENRSRLPVNEQYEFCRKVLGRNPSKIIPLKIWLCPLNKLLYITLDFKTDITHDLAIRYQGLKKFKQQMQIKSICLSTKLDTLIKSLDRGWLAVRARIMFTNFKSIKKLQSDFIDALSHWTISIRRGNEFLRKKAEERLEAYKSLLYSHLNFLYQQLDLIETLKFMANSRNVLVMSEAEKLKKFIQSRTNGLFTVVLHLPSLSKHSDVQYYVKKFYDWATENNNDATMDYVIFDDDQQATEEFPFVQVYDSGTADVVYENFKIPQSPGAVIVVKNLRGIITLSWTKEELHTDNTYFLLQYGKTKCDQIEPWTTLECVSNSITIDNLCQDQTYVFRVAVVIPIGRSSFGPNSEDITIDLVCSPPWDLQCLRVTGTNIDITWKHNLDKNGSLELDVYDVECRKHDSRQECESIQTSVRGKRVIIESLDLDTTYCVLIRAGCTDSEDLCSPTFYSSASSILVRTLLEVERAADTVRPVSKKCSINFGIDTYQLPAAGFGDPDLFKLTDYFAFKTILVLGAAGSDKTTLINAMANYILGVEWKDDFRFKLIDESQARSQTVCGTTTYSLYRMLESRLKYSLFLVDIPEFESNYCLEDDKMIVQQIQDYFYSGRSVYQLQAIYFVSPLPWLTATQQYIFDSILSVIGQDLKNCIHLIGTFTPNGLPPVLIDNGIPSFFNPTVHYKMISSAFFEHNQADDKENEMNRTDFNEAVEDFRQFFDDLNKLRPKSFALTYDVLSERKRVELLVEGIHMRTQMKLTKIDELKKMKTILSRNQENNSNVEFQVDSLVPRYADISETGQLATNCRKCKMTCHFPCRKPNSVTKDRCSAMDSISENCNICKCSSSDHFRERHRYEMVMEKVKRSSEAIRQEYQMDNAEMLTNEELLIRIDQDLENQEERLVEMMEATYPHINRLNEIAIQPHPLSIPNYINNVVKAEKHMQHPGYQQRIANLEKRRQMAEIMKNLFINAKKQWSPGYLFKFFKKKERRLGRSRIGSPFYYKPFQLFIRLFGLPVALLTMSFLFLLTYGTWPFVFFILWGITTVWCTGRLLHRFQRFIICVTDRMGIPDFQTAQRIFEFLAAKLGIEWSILIFSLFLYPVAVLYTKEVVIGSIATYLIKHLLKGLIARVMNILVRYKVSTVLYLYRNPVACFVLISTCLATSAVLIFDKLQLFSISIYIILINLAIDFLFL